MPPRVIITLMVLRSGAQELGFVEHRVSIITFEVLRA